MQDEVQGMSTGIDNVREEINSLNHRRRSGTYRADSVFQPESKRFEETSKFDPNEQASGESSDGEDEYGYSDNRSPENDHSGSFSKTRIQLADYRTEERVKEAWMDDHDRRGGVSNVETSSPSKQSKVLPASLYRNSTREEQSNGSKDRFNAVTKRLSESEKKLPAKDTGEIPVENSIKHTSIRPRNSKGQKVDGSQGRTRISSVETKQKAGTRNALPCRGNTADFDHDRGRTRTATQNRSRERQHRYPSNESRRLDNNENVEDLALMLDGDAEMLGENLDKWIGLMRRAVMADFLDTKSLVMRRHSRLLTEARTEYEKTAVVVNQELVQTKQQLKAAEIAVKNRGNTILNCAEKIGEKRDLVIAAHLFSRWRAALTRRKLENYKLQLARRHHRKSLLQQAMWGWKTEVGNVWRKLVERKIRIAAEKQMELLAIEYEKKISELSGQLYQATSLIRDSQTARVDYEETMKKAFLRGVCALNMEAMSVFNPKRGVHDSALASGTVQGNIPSREVGGNGGVNGPAPLPANMALPQGAGFKVNREIGRSNGEETRRTNMVESRLDPYGSGIESQTWFPEGPIEDGREFDGHRPDKVPDRNQTSDRFARNTRQPSLRPAVSFSEFVDTAVLSNLASPSTVPGGRQESQASAAYTTTSPIVPGGSQRTFRVPGSSISITRHHVALSGQEKGILPIASNNRSLGPPMRRTTVRDGGS